MNTLGRQLMNMTNTSDVSAACHVVKDALGRHDAVIRRLRTISAQIRAVGVASKTGRSHEPCLDVIHDLYFLQKTLRTELAVQTRTIKEQEDRLVQAEKDVTVFRSLWYKEKATCADLQAKNAAASKLLARYTCCICYENHASRALFPCLHAQFCGMCTKRLFEGNAACPICRTPLTHAKPFHLE